MTIRMLKDKPTVTFTMVPADWLAKNGSIFDLFGVYAADQSKASPLWAAMESMTVKESGAEATFYQYETFADGKWTEATMADMLTEAGKILAEFKVGA